MNKFIVFFAIGFFTFQSMQSQIVTADSVSVFESKKIELNWTPTYKEALKISRKEKKPVLIYFTGSDWCGPCKVLNDELFYTDKFKSISDNELVLLEVDIPRRKDLIDPDKMSENLYLKEKYKVKSFPTLMVVNHRGKKIAEKKGYVMTEYYYPFFKEVIRKY
ncbi:thioredoxin family protein [Polaribacter sp. R77954]|uniref:thioredoxin family protein n=1 Tax=Polaribacter sp. R77954 TaxID=3093870 RepID=UPI0037CBAF89